MNRWMAENKVSNVKNVHEFYGQSPVGMSGHQENVIFVSLWYETEAAETKSDLKVEAAAG